MLIIEGTDLVGKTTLAKKLEASSLLQHEGYVYRHLSRLPVGFDYYWGYIEHACRRSVQDRFHMSEIAYSYARGEKKAAIDPWRYVMIDGYLRTIGAYTLVITATDGILQRRYDDTLREEMYDLNTIKLANGVFYQLADYGQAHLFADGYYKNIDVNAHIHLTEDNPWPSPQDERNILEAYARHQNRWESVVAKKPRAFGEPYSKPSDLMT